MGAGPVPSGAPPPSQESSAVFSSGVRRRSLAHSVPGGPSACQGGMRPAVTASFIVAVRFFASANVSSGKGAASPSRWHEAHRRCTIAPTEAFHVAPASDGAVLLGGAIGQPGATVVATGGGLPDSSASSASTRKRFDGCALRPSTPYWSSTAPR